jgi:hypothetical protein
MNASAESDEAITTEYGKWLLIDEVLLAIASVAMAISSIRGPSRGFSIIPPRDMEVCCQYAATLHQLQLDKAVRCRSPMIVPYLGQAFHTVLLVIELDEKDEVVINVLDSRFWTFEKHQREEVLEAAWAATRVSGWFEGGTEPKVPKYATWATSAQQQNDFMCGYYTMMNAWSLAMGLRRNLDFDPDLTQRENSSFFTDLQKLVGYVRSGSADWRLVLAFLECYQFVDPGQQVHPSC